MIKACEFGKVAGICSEKGSMFMDFIEHLRELREYEIEKR